MKHSFEELELLTSQLNIKQKGLLVKLLQGQICGQDCLNVLVEHQNNAATCPHCHGHSIKRNGKISGRQRYLCKLCKKSFMSTYNTPFYRLRTPQKWFGYLQCMINSFTVRHSADETDISKNTAFLWRHRFLNY